MRKIRTTPVIFEDSLEVQSSFEDDSTITNNNQHHQQSSSPIEAISTAAANGTSSSSKPTSSSKGGRPSLTRGESLDTATTTAMMSGSNSFAQQLQQSSNSRKANQKKWASAFRVVQSMTRFKNMRHHSQSSGERVFSSNESTPFRDAHEIDPVYLALKQATERYGGGGSSNGGSRRSSANMTAGPGGGSQLHLDNSSTPSPRNLSQMSLHDSGYSGERDHHGSRNRLLGSTPHLANNVNGGGINGTSSSIAAGGPSVGQQNNFPSPIGGTPSAAAGGTSAASGGGGGRRPKLSEKMKSLSLDCADMPPPVQNSMRSGAFKAGRPLRFGIGHSGESLDLGRSLSPTDQQNGGSVPRITPRRLPPIPNASAVQHEGSHVVIHEYIGGSPEEALYLGDRMSIVDNGDPDWLHGFKTNDRSEHLLTFPATCVAPLQPVEQPMKLIQNCYIAEHKLRLYRDQVVFAQPDQTQIHAGKILIRNVHGSMAACPASYLMLLN